MKAYIIIDEFGGRHATITANTKKEALDIYFDMIPINPSILQHLAIEKKDLELFKRNVNALR